MHSNSQDVGTLQNSDCYSIGVCVAGVCRLRVVNQIPWTTYPFAEKGFPSQWAIPGCFASAHLGLPSLLFLSTVMEILVPSARPL